MTNTCETCNKTSAHDNFITACEQLETDGHPVPLIQCECGERIWRLGRFMRCAGCGREDAGRLAVVGKSDPLWDEMCKRAQERLDELLGRSQSLEYCRCPPIGDGKGIQVWPHDMTSDSMAAPSKGLTAPKAWAAAYPGLDAAAYTALSQIGPDWEGIFPAQEHLFRAFELVPPDACRCVLLGMDPYPTPGHAIGLSFAVPDGTKPLPKTLKNIIIEFQEDLGMPLPSTEFNNWAKQGVLLANAALSVKGKAGAHMKHWAEFTATWIRGLQKQDAPCVWILWGNDAKAFRPLITGANQRVIESPHPSPLAAYRGFFGSRPFSRSNELLAELGCPPIDWSSGQAEFLLA
ncbi:hypothetical protein Lal_00011112 [Lupinus albus]|nr:hypothetical protein Lal_00011112 [Lupinus albus]